MHKRYFHVLLPVEPTSVRGKSQWDGKLRQTERLLGERLEKSDNRARIRAEELKSDIDVLKSEVSEIKSTVNELKIALAGLTDKINRVIGSE